MTHQIQLRTAVLISIAGIWAGSDPVPQVPSSTPITVIARGRDGEPIRGLQLPDFQLTVDGREAEVSFGKPSPTRFLLLFDFSTSMFGSLAIQGEWHSDSAGSVTGSRLGAVTREWARMGAQTLGGLLGSQDSVRLASFGQRQIVTHPLANPGDIAAAWSSIVQGDGPSPLWDAVGSSVTLLSGDDGRRVLILVSDGRAAGSRLGFEDAADLAVHSAVTVYTTGPYAGLVGHRSDKSMLDPATALETLAKRTGGRFLVPGPGLDLRDIIARVVDDLRKHYALIVTAPGITQAASIGVTTSVPNVAVVVRRQQR